MIDTAPEVERQLQARYASRSPAQRVAMATGMFAMAKALARAGLLMEAGPLDEREIRRRLILRLHGDAFSESEAAVIARSIG